jgi:15-cis-phytoene synthase
MSLSDTVLTETRLALAYAPRHLRSDFAGILALDRQFGAIVSQARDPHLARIRLAWWADQLMDLASSCNAPHPDLQFAQTLVRRHDVNPELLARLTQGWDTLLCDDSLSVESLAAYGALRGGTLFAIAAQVARIKSSACVTMGTAWALADFVFRCSDPQVGCRAAMLARDIFEAHSPKQLRSSLLTFAMLARFAQIDIRQKGDQPYKSSPPARAVQALHFALFG